MSKYIKSYCPDCKRVTTHKITTEDAYGASGITRIFTTIISLGTSNLMTETKCTCLSCGNTKIIP